MATLAVAGIGALGSSALGFGWQAGWLIGSVVGAAAFAPRLPDQEGPRLADLGVSSSAYGTPIPIAFGTLRLSGNMIWSTGLIEEETSRRVGRSLFSRGQRITEYSYRASFALAFAEGPAERVLRVWADGKLIHDVTDRSLSGGISASDSLRMRFHPGDEAQLPDPLIEAVEGAGAVPAHRGLCYLVFEDFELADFANRIPNITAEIAFRAVAQYPVQDIAWMDGPITSFQRPELAVDWRRGHAFLVSNIGARGIRRIELRTMQETRQALSADILGSAEPLHCLFCGPDGFLYAGAGSNSRTPLVRIDPDALREVARFGVSESGLSNTETAFARPTALGMIARDDRFFLMHAGGAWGTSLGLLDAASMGYLWHETGLSESVAGLVGGGAGEGWVLTGAAGIARLHRIEAPLVWRSAEAVFTPAGIDPAATAFTGGFAYGATGSIGGLMFDPGDGGLVFWCEVSGPGIDPRAYLVKWRRGLGMVWRAQVPFLPVGSANANAASSARLTGQQVAIATTSMGGGWRVATVDLRSGAVLEDAQGWGGGGSLAGAQVYEGRSNSLVAIGSNAMTARLWLGRAGGQGAALASVVADLAARAGLGPADIDVSELTDMVPGYVVSRQGPVRSALEPLASAFFFDGVESDDRLAFRKRGAGDPVALDPDLLIALDAETGEAWRERRTQAVELPERVSVLHLDPDADYAQGAQSEKRAARPVPTMASHHQVTVELPLVLEAAAARSIAARMLYSAWVERSGYELHLPCDALRLEPTDVIDLALPSGARFTARLERVDIGADFTLDARAVSQEAASYTIARPADGGIGRPPSVIHRDAATRWILPDVPLLRDVDAAGPGLSVVPEFMGGLSTAPWPGASLYRSADGVRWDFAGRARTGMAHGVALDALPAPASPWSTDEAHALRVAMVTGADRLESVSQSAMLNGANMALLIRADGGPEVLQFREVDPLGDGGFALRGLLRGRRGTEGFTHGHAAGDRFVLVEPGAFGAVVLPLDDLGQPRFWKAVGVGEDFDAVPATRQTHTGRDLMPYAPVHLRARSVPGGIEIAWICRTRLGGALRDGTGSVPLSETVEAYEVDILDGPGGAVLRTLSSGAPAVLYADEAIAADFGATPAALSLAVVQISEAVGRGFPGAATVEVR